MARLADVDGYLERIGLRGEARLATIHRAHATTIPFENFDSFTGTPVSLAPDRLFDKMVTRRRGGYCFEHNLLLMGALESIGVDEVAPMLARVRLSPEGSPRPLNHLLLRVVEDGRPWLADVGFGGGGLLEPIPFEPGAESEQSGWRYRLVEDGPELVLQSFTDGDWRDAYGFVPEPVPIIDVEVNNWFTCTHPTSPFVTGIMAGARRPDRCLSLFVSDTAVLMERPVGEPSSVRDVDIAEVPGVLASRFGIAGVVVGTTGRLALA